ncbi:uncharacterized protein BJX67DRAFT_283298 [Aspergillus lucknowensis]|uniref:Arrestin-like N-terminal domain-containing protein n=1 Tax=Aspergillus lucknowensis TaxID=176173 RepID=A0ABR4M131_9EURO
MLVINLRDPNTAHAPGDEVAGQVIYQPTTLQTSLSVRMIVELAGRTKVKIRGHNGDRKSTYRGRADLLRLIVSDTCGTQTVWPFTFLFPATTAPIDPQLADTRSLTHYMKTIPTTHPLPPTFSETLGFSLTPTHVCSVEYIIRASVWTTLASKPKKLGEQTVPITFRPRFDPRLPGMIIEPSRDISLMQENVRIKSLLLLPENKDRSLTFREKTQSLFHQSQLPYFDFQVYLTQPTKIHLGQQIPCTIRIVPSPATSTAPEIPSFTLTHFNFFGKGKTEVWASAWVVDRTSSNIDIIPRTNQENLGDFLPQKEYLKTVMVPSIFDQIPSFSTYNIKRKYVLTAGVIVECVGKRITVLNKAEVTILPAHHDDGQIKSDGDPKLGTKHNKGVP